MPVILTCTYIFPTYLSLAETPPKQIELIKTTVKAECNAYRPIVEKYDWDVEKMLKIMELESGCNPNALNNNPKTGDYSVGLMQINLYGANAKYRPSEQELKDPEKNIAFAYELFKSGGFRHWTTAKKVL